MKYFNQEMNGQEDRCVFNPDVHSTCRSLHEYDFECSCVIWFGDFVLNFVYHYDNSHNLFSEGQS